MIDSVFSNPKFRACDLRYGIERSFYKYVISRFTGLNDCGAVCSQILNVVKECNDREYTIEPSDLPAECGKMTTVKVESNNLKSNQYPLRDKTRIV